MSEPITSTGTVTTPKKKPTTGNPAQLQQIEALKAELARVIEECNTLKGQLSTQAKAPQMSTSKFLQELDQRGFKDEAYAIALIRRHDEAKAVAERERLLLDERAAEIERLEARLVERENRLINESNIVLSRIAEMERQQNEVNRKLSILSQLNDVQPS